MQMTRKTWLLGSLLLLAACADDKEAQIISVDAGHDAGALPDSGLHDASSSIDSSIDGGGSIDATVVSEAGPGDASADASVLKIEVFGDWQTDYGPEHITNTDWSGDTIVQFDNTTRIAIVQNPATSMYSPSKYNKNVWTPLVNGAFYYCTQDFGKDTIAEALATTMKADATDPANSGCGDGNFSWTKVYPTLEIAGSWQHAGASVLITSSALRDVKIESYDNDSNSAVVSTGTMGDAGVTPTFGKLVWTQPTPTTLYLCNVATDLPTKAAAETSTATADPTQLSTGCAGAAWTSFTKE